MVRHIILGNGNMLVCMDKDHQIRDFYFPFVGQENHVSSKKHRIGVFVNGKFSWLNRNEWKLEQKYETDSLVSHVRAVNEKLQIQLELKETVHPEENIFIRSVNVWNNSKNPLQVKIFLSQHFNISEDNIGDTVFFDPRTDSIIAYKARRYFLMGGRNEKMPFDDYTTGLADSQGREGSYVDAEDGKLAKNPIEHGSVDSCIGFSLQLSAQESKNIDYWICVGKKYKEICDLQNHILKKGCSTLLDETNGHWNKWINESLIDFQDLSEESINLFKRSSLIIRAQTDNHGAIIAGNDTHVFRRKEDTYSYMWPRDGALVSRSFDRLKKYEVTEKFFDFCADVLSEEGYLLHKYRPDGSLGSSWHPWIRDGKIQLPIQEDETALVLDALWKHYDKHKDDKKAKKLYKKMIKPSADFMAEYRNPSTNLPLETYDLWEEKLGVHTFTASTVFAGLMAAANFAKIFGTASDEKKYLEAASQVREAVIKHLFDDESGIFIKRIHYEGQNEIRDKTIDSSTFYGLFEYGILEVDDPRLERTVEKTVEALWNKTPVGGLYRYENDEYYRVSGCNIPNPWFIPTLWLAEYYIAKAKKPEELKKAKEIIEWATKWALPSGSMSEQINPYTGEAISVAPLTWSHAAFIIATIKYCDRFGELKGKK